MELAIWSLLGTRPVTMLAWESFGAGWVTDVAKQLKLHAEIRTADYGQICDLTGIDPANDVVFTWNGTTSGVRVPDADWIAADLIAQAEHDPDARAVLITPNRTLAAQVASAVAARMPADGPARESLAAHGAVVIAASPREAIELANSAAPEHLVVDDEKLAKQVRNAGSVFVGLWTAQVAGDYAIGCNHVLPTAGAARVRGGLSAADFVRQITVQRLTPKGLRRIGPSVVALARAEGLEGHARSIEIRLKPAAAAKRTRGDT